MSNYNLLSERKEEIDEKVERFFLQNKVGTSPAFYDEYDYSTFWKGRDFEYFADHTAVSRMLIHISSPHRRLIDVGAGTGRMAPLYEKKWDKFVLLDPSKDQLRIAHKKLSYPEKCEFVLGFVESNPLPDAYCDTAICTRVFHYIYDPLPAIQELWRVLIPGGYLILEIPNKRHAKDQLAAMFSSSARRELASRKPKHIFKRNDNFVFVNHDPETIRDTLLAERFDILEILSVSNFRHPVFKKIIPLNLLLILEKILQPVLAKFWFGPSIYFLVRKKKF